MISPSKMQAPEGVSAATIQNHSYKINAKGQIKVAVQEHVEDLRRHGFVDAIENDPDIEEQIDAMDDRDQLVDFIEERGGDVPSGMTKKKELRALAKQTVVDQQNASAEKPKKIKKG